MYATGLQDYRCSAMHTPYSMYNHVNQLRGCMTPFVWLCVWGYLVKLLKTGRSQMQQRALLHRRLSIAMQQLLHSKLSITPKHAPTKYSVNQQAATLHFMFHDVCLPFNVLCLWLSKLKIVCSKQRAELSYMSIIYSYFQLTRAGMLNTNCCSLIVDIIVQCPSWSKSSSSWPSLANSCGLFCIFFCHRCTLQHTGNNKSKVPVMLFYCHCVGNEWQTLSHCLQHVKWHRPKTASKLHKKHTEY